MSPLGASNVLGWRKMVERLQHIQEVLGRAGDSPALAAADRGRRMAGTTPVFSNIDKIFRAAWHERDGAVRSGMA